jgi:hypothetical protein
MKTKIRTFIAVCIMAFAGLNASATVSYINFKNNVVFGDEKNVQNLKAEESLATMNSKTETIEAEVNVIPGDILDYQKEAEILTKSVADREEAKTVQSLLEKTNFIFNSARGADEPVLNGERAEAQLVTKMIADQVEAKAIQKLVEDGRL